MIPRNRNEITIEYLQNVLKEFPPIESFEIIPLATQGATSTVLKLKLLFSVKKENENFRHQHIIFKFFEKLDVPDEESKNEKETKEGVVKEDQVGFVKNEFFRTRLYKAENLFYEIIRPLVPSIRVPKVFYMDANLPNNFVIIMEDLFSVDKKKENEENQVLSSGTFEDVERVIEEISIFHKKFWQKNPGEGRVVNGIKEGNELPFLKNQNLGFVTEEFAWQYHVCFFRVDNNERIMEKNYGFFNPENCERVVLHYYEMLDTGLSNFSKFSSEFSDPKRFSEGIKKLIKNKDLLKRYVRDSLYNVIFFDPLTIRHTDLRLDNIAFGEERELAGIFDWQTYSLGSPFVDIASMVYNSLKTEDLKNTSFEADLLKKYYELLGEKIQSGMKFEEMMKMYRNGLYYEVFRFFYFGAKMFTDFKGMEKLYKEAIRISENILEGLLNHVIVEKNE